LQFRNLTLGYERHPAVHHLSGSVEAGALIAVVGPNGAGKSTLLKAIAGLLPPLAGTIERRLAPRDIAYLPQVAEIDRSFPIHIYDLIAMGLWRRVSSFGGIGRRERNEIHSAIAAVGLIGFERRTIAALSGGQMQRALFARLLLQDSQLIVLNEPFNAVDGKTIADLIEVIRGWHSEGRTVLAALHDFTWCGHVPQTLLIARELVALGRNRARAQRGQFDHRAAHVRGLRRAACLIVAE
jgi:zinc/manganese transport system ATP-binding protein